MNRSATESASLASTKRQAALILQLKAAHRTTIATRTAGSHPFFPSIPNASADDSAYRKLEDAYRKLEEWISDADTATPTEATAPGLLDSSLVNAIVGTSEPSEVTAALSLLDLRRTATRLDRLLAMTRDDPEEPTISLHSLRSLALYLASAPHMSDAEIGVSPEGLLQMEWLLTDGGIVAMEFLPDGLIRYAAVANSPTAGTSHRPRAHGTGSWDGVLAATASFLNRRHAE